MSRWTSLIIGILGTGQLARMLVTEGSKLGYSFYVLGPSSSGHSGCAEDLSATCSSLEEFVDRSDVITVETENIPRDVLEKCHDKILPSVEIIQICQDRLLEKRKAHSCDLSTASYQKIDTFDDLKLCSGKFPAILKTRSMGYDGKGQYLIEKKADIGSAWKAVDKMPCILEEKISFSKEFSILVFSNGQQMRTLGPIENIHKKGILLNSQYPSTLERTVQMKSREIAENLARDMGLQGTLCIEFFYLEDGSILLNEMSPRVHNSGHWTLNGASTSQFEQHIRAIMGLYLPQIRTRGTIQMMNMIGKVDLSYLGTEGAYSNIYNKEEREGRKVGHITLVKDSWN